MTHPNARQRRSIRLDRYDYTQPGAYCVTIVTADRVNRFGTVTDGQMRLNLIGQMVLREWQRLPGRFPGLALDTFVVMPNHVHGVLVLGGADGGTGVGANVGADVGAQRPEHAPMPGTAALRPGGRDDTNSITRPGDLAVSTSETAGSVPVNDRPHVDPGSVGAIVRAFKSATTLRYHRTRGTDPGPLWQRNFFEHIARGPGDLEKIRAYILANPANWEDDRVYSDRKGL